VLYKKLVKIENSLSTCHAVRALLLTSQERIYAFSALMRGDNEPCSSCPKLVMDVYGWWADG
jgi:hypothetical protein